MPPMALFMRRYSNRGNTTVFLWPTLPVQLTLGPPSCAVPLTAPCLASRTLSTAAPVSARPVPANASHEACLGLPFDSESFARDCLSACESKQPSKLVGLIGRLLSSGSRLSHSLQSRLVPLLAAMGEPITNTSHWREAVGQVVLASAQPLSPKALWRCLHPAAPRGRSPHLPMPPPQHTAEQMVLIAAEQLDISAIKCPARQVWCDASAAACARALLGGMSGGLSGDTAGVVMQWLRALHFGKAALLRVNSAGSGLLCEQSAAHTAHGVPASVIALDSALARGAEEAVEGGAGAEDAQEIAQLPVVQLRALLLEADALADAVPFPEATAVVLAALLRGGHLKFARQLFHATAPRLVAACWGARPRVHPWGRSGLQDVQRLSSALQREGQMRRPLAHAPAVAAAYVAGLVQQGKLAEAEQVHFAQRGQAASATLAALLPAVAVSGQVQHFAYLVGDGARVGTRAPAQASEWLFSAVTADDMGAPPAATDAAQENAPPPPVSTAASVDRQVLLRQLQAELDSLNAGYGTLSVLGLCKAAVASGPGAAAAAHLCHAHRGSVRQSMVASAAATADLQRIQQLRAAYSRLLAAGCEPSWRLEEHLCREATRLCVEGSQHSQAGTPPAAQPEACWRLLQESLLSLQDTFPQQNRVTARIYGAALGAIRTPWWFVGDPSLQLARGQLLADALVIAPQQLQVVADALVLSKRLAEARSDDSVRCARRVAAGLKLAQVPLMALEERLKVVCARAEDSETPLQVRAAAPWLAVQRAASEVRRSVADLRAVAAHEHAARQAARPLRNTLRHIERAVQGVLG